MAGSFQREAYAEKLSNERKCFMPMRWLSTIEGVPGEASGFSSFEGKPAKSVALKPFRQLAKGLSYRGRRPQSRRKIVCRESLCGAQYSYGGFDSLKVACGCGPNAE
jgi:hypothetical protein